MEVFEANSLKTTELQALDGVQDGTLIGWRGELFRLHVKGGAISLHEVDQTEVELPPTSTVILLDQAPSCIIQPLVMWQEEQS